MSKEVGLKMEPGDKENTIASQGSVQEFVKNRPEKIEILKNDFITLRTSSFEGVIVISERELF